MLHSSVFPCLTIGKPRRVGVKFPYFLYHQGCHLQPHGNTEIQLQGLEFRVATAIVLFSSREVGHRSSMGGVVETRMGGKFRNFEEKKWKIHKNLKKWYFRTFSGLKVELPCQKKWFWTNDYMYCHSRNHPTFTPAVSRKPKEVHHRIEVWRTRTAGPSIQVLWRSRSLQLAGVITYRLHVLFKTSPCQTKKVCTRIPTKNQRRGHAPAKSMALPRTSASAKPPRERCRMDTNSRSNLSVEKTPDTMTSWSVDDWTAAVAASTENRSQVTKIPNPVPKHKRSTAMWRLKISWTHTGLNTVPPAPRKLQSKWPIFCSTRLFQNAVIAGLQGERKALWSATHIQHHKTNLSPRPPRKLYRSSYVSLGQLVPPTLPSFFWNLCQDKNLGIWAKKNTWNCQPGWFISFSN